MFYEPPSLLKPSHSFDSPGTSMASRIRVLLVDDHRMFRLGLRNIIDRCEHMAVVGEASNGVEAIEAVRLIRPDVVVMDINMPKINGIQATQQIKQYSRYCHHRTLCADGGGSHSANAIGGYVIIFEEGFGG